MDYSKIIESIKNASGFDLYRLSVAIDFEMNSPKRIAAIKSSLIVGSTIHYFEAKANKLVRATISKLGVSHAHVKNIHDGAHWKIPYYMINTNNVDINIYDSTKKGLSKNELKIGDIVGFTHNGRNICGVTIRLNTKTASVLTTDNSKWRVSYGALSHVIDAEAEKLKEIFIGNDKPV